MSLLNLNIIGNLMNLLVRPNRGISQGEFDSLVLQIIEKLGKENINDKNLAKIIKTEKFILVNEPEKDEDKSSKKEVEVLEVRVKDKKGVESGKGQFMEMNINHQSKETDVQIENRLNLGDEMINSFKLKNSKKKVKQPILNNAFVMSLDPDKEQEESNKIFTEMFNLLLGAGKIEEVNTVSKLKKTEKKGSKQEAKVSLIKMNHRKIVKENQSLEIKGKKGVRSKKEQFAEMNLKKQEKEGADLKMDKKLHSDNAGLRIKANNLKISRYDTKKEVLNTFELENRKKKVEKTSNYGSNPRRKIKMILLKENEKGNPKIARQFLITKENTEGHGGQESIIQLQLNHQGKVNKDMPLSLNNAKSMSNLEPIKKQEKKIEFKQELNRLGVHEIDKFQDHSEKIKVLNVQPLMTDEDKQALINKISQAIHYQIKENGKEEIVVHLKPEFLGKVSIKIISEGDHIKINMLTENHMAKEILNPYMPSLQRFLLEQGIPVQEISVFLAWQGYQGNRQAQGGYRFKNSLLRSNHHSEPALKEVSYGYTSDAVYLDYLA